MSSDKNTHPYEGTLTYKRESGWVERVKSKLPTVTVDNLRQLLGCFEMQCSIVATGRRLTLELVA